MQTPNHHRNNLNNGNNLELEVDVLVDSSVVFGHVDKDIEGTLTIKNHSTVLLYIIPLIIFLHWLLRMKLK